MNDRPFLDQTNKPTEQALQAALGSMYACYKEIIALVSSFSQEWTFTKSSGWMLKIYDQKKALLYLIPLDEAFKVSMAIRENEREKLLFDDKLGSLRDKLSSSKKYMEGFALQFDITNMNEFQPLALFVRELIILRL